MPVTVLQHAITDDPSLDGLMGCIANRRQVWDGEGFSKRWRWFTARDARHLRELKADAAATVRRAEARRRFSRRSRCVGTA